MRTEKGGGVLAWGRKKLGRLEESRHICVSISEPVVLKVEFIAGSRDVWKSRQLWKVLIIESRSFLYAVESH